MKLAREISNTIKKMKSTSWQKQEYLSKVKLHFKIEEAEKWIVTKLRMMLFKEGANLDLFQLQLPANPKLEMQKKEESNNQKDRVLKKTSRINRSLDVLVSSKKGMRKPRLSPEEKQLMKLRSQPLPQVMETPIFQISKEEFLSDFNLVKKQGLLITSASQTLNVGEGQKNTKHFHSKSDCQKEQNTFKVNVLKALSSGRN